MQPRLPKVVLDGIFFQFYETGIARLWHSVLGEWAASGFGQNVLLLDRAGTAPRVDGIASLTIPRYDVENSGRDCKLLQYVCDSERADLFLSSYYTVPVKTPSALMCYDMIPEVINADLTDGQWRQKQYAIRHASGFVAISQNTLKDLRRFFPAVAHRSGFVAPCGIAPAFTPAPPEEIADFRARFGIDRPYFLLVGERCGLDGYKNARLFFEGLAAWQDRSRYAVVCTGGAPVLEESLQALVPDMPVSVVKLGDEELRAAYSGAAALVYPSLYEGFGMPIAEAMACGCPVITCRNSSLEEVGGDACLYVSEHDAATMTAALAQVVQADVRSDLVARGLERARLFTWERSAAAIARALVEIDAQVRQVPHLRPDSLWEAFRAMEAEMQDESRYTSGAKLRAAHERWYETQHKWEHTLFQMQERQREIDGLRELIRGMESTKVWKLRSTLLGVKNRLKRLLKR